MDIDRLGTILFLIEENDTLLNEQVIQKFILWSEDKANRFSEDEIKQVIEKLLKTEVTKETLILYITRIHDVR